MKSLPASPVSKQSVQSSSGGALRPCRRTSKDCWCWARRSEARPSYNWSCVVNARPARTTCSPACPPWGTCSARGSSCFSALFHGQTTSCFGCSCLATLLSQDSLPLPPQPFPQPSQRLTQLPLRFGGLGVRAAVDAAPPPTEHPGRTACRPLKHARRKQPLV